MVQGTAGTTEEHRHLQPQLGDGEPLLRQDGDQRVLHLAGTAGDLLHPGDVSPRSVLTYLTGNAKVKGVEITPKYMGNKRLVEIAIATLVTDRALLLIGEPGTAKSWLSEHLSAAVTDISLTPLSRVLAVAMTEKPLAAGTSSPSSGTESRFS